jgi:hypothetical protein
MRYHVEVFDAKSLARLPVIKAPGNYDLTVSPDSQWLFGAHTVSTSGLNRNTAIAQTQRSAIADVRDIRTSSQNQHRVAVAVEAILVLDCVTVRFQSHLAPRERAHQHQQR